MARIPGVKKGGESWLVRMANRRTRKELGAALEPIAVMGHHTWVLGGAGAFETAMGRAKLVPESIKTLAGVKAAMQIGCPF